MIVLKALARALAAEILCLFINVVLAGSGLPVIRAVCLVCTAGILTVLMADLGIKTAEHGRDKDRTLRKILAAGAAVTPVPLASWVLLFISAGGGIDWYRWHKLLNAPFLQLYNLIESGASSADLDRGETLLMLPAVIIPAAALILPYIYVCRRSGRQA